MVLNLQCYPAIKVGHPRVLVSAMSLWPQHQQFNFPVFIHWVRKESPLWSAIQLAPIYPCSSMRQVINEQEMMGGNEWMSWEKTLRSLYTQNWEDSWKRKKWMSNPHEVANFPELLIMYFLLANHWARFLNQSKRSVVSIQDVYNIEDKVHFRQRGK